MSAPNPSISIVLADDHPVALHGVTGILGAQPDMKVLAACNDGRSAADAIRQFAPDIAVLDIRMSGLDGLEVLSAIAVEGVGTKVVFFTAAATDNQILTAIANGAKGILLKDAAPDRLVDCVRNVAAGKQWFPTELVESALRRDVNRHAERDRFADRLTTRERQIILLVADGLSNKGIARHTNLTEGTIKLHLHNIYEKLQVTNRTALTALAIRVGRWNSLGEVLILLVSADLLERLAGQHAQAGAPAGAQVSGRVEIPNSIAVVQHAKGVVENLEPGAALLKGDFVMTGDANAPTLIFTDGTALNTDASPRMALSELIYDSNSTSNSGVINLVKGTFPFVSDQVAHNRDADVTSNVYQFIEILLNDSNRGSAHRDVLGPNFYTVGDPATQVTLSSEPNQIRVREASKSAPIVQQKIVRVPFPIFLANPANARPGQVAPQPRNDTLTPPQDQPQPPPGDDPAILLQFAAAKATTFDKVMTTVHQPSLADVVQNQQVTLARSIATARIDGNDIIHFRQARSGFSIPGSESGADGQIVTAILDRSGNVVSDPSNVLTVAETLNGNTLSSIRTIKVTDPLVSKGVIAQESYTNHSGLAAAGAPVKNNFSLALSNALKITSGTFELNSGSLQTRPISIALADVFVDRTAALSTPIVNDGHFVLGNNAVVDTNGALSGLGSFTINPGATLQFRTGLHTVARETTDNGKVEVTNGTLKLAGTISGTGSLQTDSGATLQLDSAHSLNVAFTGSAGELILKNPGNSTGTMSGHTGSDQIDLVNINWQTAKVSSVSYSATTNVTTLVITDGQHADSILLVGDYRSSTWMFSNDGSGGTIVVDPLKTAVTLDVTESTVVTDTIASRSDAATPSNSTTTDDTMVSASAASGTATVDLASIGFDLSLDHIQFEDTNVESVVTAKVAVTDSDGLHAASHWLANFFSSTADDHFSTLQPPAPALQISSTVLATTLGDDDTTLRSLPTAALNPQFAGLAGQPGAHAPTDPAVDPDDHATLQQSDEGLVPAAHLAVGEADPQFAHFVGQTGAHVPAEVPAADPDDHATPPSLPTAALDAPVLEDKHAPTVDSSSSTQPSLPPQYPGLPSAPAAHEFSDIAEETSVGSASHSPLDVAGLTLPDQLASPPDELALPPAHPGPVHATPHLTQASQLSEHLLSVSPATDSAHQLIGVASQTEAHALSGYMVPPTEDQFQFADLHTNEPRHVPHPADLISHSAAHQFLIEATNPADHFASANEISTLPGPEFVMLHSHQGVHANGGII
jgi:two-component system nitrate/nitrite response regulator NarL